MSDSSEFTTAYETFEYSDPLQFRSAAHLGPTDVIPLTNSIDAKQDILRLPGCQLCQFTTFPRIIDGRVPPNSTLIGFTMHDSSTVQFNGWTKDLPSIMIGYGGAGYTLLEQGVTKFGTILFETEIRNRNWPERDINTILVVTTAEAEGKLRNLLGSAFELALKSPVEFAASAHGLKELFLSAIDEAVRASDSRELARIAKKNWRFGLIRRIDTYLSDHITEPVYSDVVANDIGVSVRTLHQVVMEYRGMSPQRYIRLKRLWSVRKRLLAGQESVKSCALSHGFRHMGDFARLYRAQFGETPSQTRNRSDAKASETQARGTFRYPVII